MRNILNVELRLITGGYTSFQGSFSTNSYKTIIEPGFKVTVTDKSSFGLGDNVFYADKVVDSATGKILFDGTNNSFCMNGYSFISSPMIKNDSIYGHSYLCLGAC